MTAGAWLYLVFSAALAIVFAGIVAHYFDAGRGARAERPRFRMLEDDADPQPPGNDGR